jgi:hypothetical protein
MVRLTGNVMKKRPKNLKKKKTWLQQNEMEVLWRKTRFTKKLITLEGLWLGYIIPLVAFYSGCSFTHFSFSSLPCGIPPMLAFFF